MRIEDAKPVLGQRTGDAGMITTFHPDGVRAIGTAMKAMSLRKIAASELEPPPGVRIRRIKEGEQVTEAQLFGEIFSSPLVAIEINDRYLRSDHHEKRLRSYLSLVTPKSETTTLATISTLAAEIQPSRQAYRSSFAQQEMFARLAADFPKLKIQYLIEQDRSALPHDRFIILTRADGTKVRIGIGIGLDFIRADGQARSTDVVIEDPFES
jgi:hypothetical protein